MKNLSSPLHNYCTPWTWPQLYSVQEQSQEQGSVAHPVWKVQHININLWFLITTHFSIAPSKLCMGPMKSNGSFVKLICSLSLRQKLHDWADISVQVSKFQDTKQDCRAASTKHQKLILNFFRNSDSDCIASLLTIPCCQSEAKIKNRDWLCN